MRALVTFAPLAQARCDGGRGARDPAAVLRRRFRARRRRRGAAGKPAPLRRRRPRRRPRPIPRRVAQGAFFDEPAVFIVNVHFSVTEIHRSSSRKRPCNKHIPDNLQTFREIYDAFGGHGAVRGRGAVAVRRAVLPGGLLARPAPRLLRRHPTSDPKP